MIVRERKRKKSQSLASLERKRVCFSRVNGKISKACINIKFELHDDVILGHDCVKWHDVGHERGSDHVSN